jgi:hypothetical protein
VVIHRFLASALVVVCTLTASRARALQPCEVRWEGTSVPAEWSDALRDVRTFAAQLTAEATDCRIIVVSPDEDGATVIFTTVDGRSARRRVSAPRELRSLVEALLVNGRDPAPMPPPPEAMPASEPSPAPSRESVPPASPVPVAIEGGEVPVPVPPSDAPHLLLGAGAGVKGSFPHDVVAGVGQVFAGASFARWELAAFGRLELEHDAPTDGNERRLQYSAVGGGAMFGRREPIGPLVLIAGARAAVLAAEEERGGRHDGSGQGKVTDTFLDPRLGLYAGCIFLESSRVRFRVQVDADGGVLQHRAELAELPAFPRWNLGVSLGAETGLFR